MAESGGDAIVGHDPEPGPDVDAYGAVPSRGVVSSEAAAALPPTPTSIA
jgi:hypothetical protein